MSNLDKAFDDWSERQKFWWETGRTVVLGIAAAYLAAIILQPSERRLQHEGEVESTKLKIRAEAIEKFSSASHSYTAAAFSSCNNPDDKKAKHEFHGQAYVNFQQATLRLERSFGDIGKDGDKPDSGNHQEVEGKTFKSDITGIRSLMKNMFEACKAPPEKGQPDNTCETKNLQPKWNELRCELKERDTELAGLAWDSLRLTSKPTRPNFWWPFN